MRGTYVLKCIGFSGSKAAVYFIVAYHILLCGTFVLLFQSYEHLLLTFMAYGLATILCVRYQYVLYFLDHSFVSVLHWWLCCVSGSYGLTSCCSRFCLCRCTRTFSNTDNGFTETFFYQGPSWPWSYGSWIYNYLCNLCLSPLKLWAWISHMAVCTPYNIMW